MSEADVVRKELGALLHATENERNSLRARVAELEGQLRDMRILGGKTLAERNDALNRVDELEAERTVADRVIVAREKEIAMLDARVAELEAEDTNLRKIVDAVKDNPPMSSHTELVALLIQVVHCGGDCSAELLAKIEHATQEEAGWTEKA